MDGRYLGVFRIYQTKMTQVYDYFTIVCSYLYSISTTVKIKGLVYYNDRIFIPTPEEDF